MEPNGSLYLLVFTLTVLMASRHYRVEEKLSLTDLLLTVHTFLHETVKHLLKSGKYDLLITLK